MMLALDVPVRKEFVKAEKAVSPSKLYRYSAFSQSITVSDGWKLFSLSKSGANGDPTKASRKKGEKILAEAVKRLVELAREIHEGKILPDPPVGKPERTKRRA
jgi:creatinine amidohydrolase/Fe(II)-dependent formamide hydrolase-like protein